MSADGLFSREHPGPHAGPSLASVSLSITFNSLTVTVYNVSILQNRSVNSGLAEQRLRKINNSNARDDSAAAPFPPGFVVSSCSAKGGTAERVGAAGAKGRIPSHAADPGRPAGPAPLSQTKAIPEPLGPRHAATEEGPGFPPCGPRTPARGRCAPKCRPRLFWSRSPVERAARGSLGRGQGAEAPEPASGREGKGTLPTEKQISPDAPASPRSRGGGHNCVYFHHFGQKSLKATFYFHPASLKGPR